jgi:hypothetical protein
MRWTVTALTSGHSLAATFHHQVAQKRLEALRDQANAMQGHILQGDVWSAHLPFVDAYFVLDSTVKVIALEREREKVVTSFDELSKPLKKNNFQTFKPGVEYAPYALRHPYLRISCERVLSVDMRSARCAPRSWNADPFWDPFFPKFNGAYTCVSARWCQRGKTQELNRGSVGAGTSVQRPRRE